MLKMLMFDFRDSEKEFFNNYDTSDFQIDFFKESLDENTVIAQEAKDNAVILSVFISSRITEKILNQFKNLQIITTRSTGYNHIDLEACRRRNISVFNVSDYGRTSVAQYTIGIILAMVRNVIKSANDVKNRHISYEKYEGRDISDMTLGVIGTGSIGSAVCEMAKTFGMEIYAYDIRKNENISDFVKYVSFEEVLNKSDIITLHLPYFKEFYHLISEKEFELMKNGVYIINTARGELIDASALYNAINNNKIAGAALDVVECEELISENDEFNSKLKGASCDCLENVIITQKLMGFDNVIITPHIAYNTKEGVNKILNTTFLNIKNHFKGIHENQII